MNGLPKSRKSIWSHSSLQEMTLGKENKRIWVILVKDLSTECPTGTGRWRGRWIRYSTSPLGPFKPTSYIPFVFAQKTN